MEYVVYVLKDETGKFYKGVTSNLERRLKEHQQGKTKTTSRMQQLSVAYTERFDTFNQARKREIYFKSAAGRRFLKQRMGP
jgi:putative endonuclease